VKLLLDTHIWIWSLLEPARLEPRVRRALEGRTNELWLSPISTWELVVLVQKRRVVLGEHLESWLEKARAAAPLREALLSHDIALASADVDLPHPDPADRLLVATARVLGLTLVTADERLLKSKQVRTLRNRVAAARRSPLG
jgi:PIN domain nuclease of toxin-antitoxin system